MKIGHLPEFSHLLSSVIDHNSDFKQRRRGRRRGMTLVIFDVIDSQSHISAQMGNCVDSLFSMDFSHQKPTKERGKV